MSVECWRKLGCWCRALYPRVCNVLRSVRTPRWYAGRAVCCVWLTSCPALPHVRHAPCRCRFASSPSVLARGVCLLSVVWVAPCVAGRDIGFLLCPFFGYGNPRRVTRSGERSTAFSLRVSSLSRVASMSLVCFVVLGGLLPETERGHAHVDATLRVGYRCGRLPP